MTTFPNRIKKLRDSKKLSMEQLSSIFAENYNATISKSSISRWEKGQATPDIDDANLYADYFNVSLDWLTGREITQKIDTIAAHIDEDVTEEEMEDIKKYIEFIKSQRD